MIDDIVNKIYRITFPGGTEEKILAWDVTVTPAGVLLVSYKTSRTTLSVVGRIFAPGQWLTVTLERGPDAQA